MEKGFRQGKKSVSSRSSIVPIGVASAASPALEWVWRSAREIVEAHGGRIRAQNAAGGGAEFKFSLPTTEMEKLAHVK